MSEMVERVARALCDDMPARDIAGREYAPLFDESAEHVQAYWRCIARAALEAMREPTEEMIVAASHVLADNGNMIEEEDYALVSMMADATIDAALAPAAHVPSKSEVRDDG